MTVKRLLRAARSVTDGVAKCVSWLPVTYHDRDFDWSYMAEIICVTLRRMERAEREWVAPESSQADTIQRTRGALWAAMLWNAGDEPLTLEQETALIYGCLREAFGLMGDHLPEWWT